MAEIIEVAERKTDLDMDMDMKRERRVQRSVAQRPHAALPCATTSLLHSHAHSHSRCSTAGLELGWARLHIASYRLPNYLSRYVLISISQAPMFASRGR
jgi:hypothetical protein